MKYTSCLLAYEDGTDRVFQNVGIKNSDAGELPRRKHTTFRTRRTFEIKQSVKLMFTKLNQQNTQICLRICYQLCTEWKVYSSNLCVM